MTSIAKGRRALGRKKKSTISWQQQRKAGHNRECTALYVDGQRYLPHCYVTQKKTKLTFKVALSELNISL